MELPIELFKYEKYATRPIDFFADVLETTLHKWQMDVLKQVQELFASVPGENLVLPIAVSGANGTGKSRFGMQLMIWHFCCHPHSRNVMLTNSTDQTRRNLYSPLQSKIEKMFLGHLAISDKRTCFRGKGFDTDGSWDINILPQSRVESGITGLHDPNMFFFYDECIDFPDHVWRALENMWTQGRVLCFCSANPKHTKSYFYKLFTTTGTIWKTRSVSVFDLQNSFINMRVIDNKLVTYGEKSAEYRTSVLGKFPITYAGVSFPPEKIRDCMSRTIEGVRPVNMKVRSVLSFDPAKGSIHGDTCAFCLRRDNIVYKLESHEVTDLHEFVEIAYREITNSLPELVVVDINGFGYGFYLLLLQKFNGRTDHIVGLLTQSKSYHGMGFVNLRTELFHCLKEWILSDSSRLPRDEDILEVLPHMLIDMNGDKLFVTKKGDLHSKFGNCRGVFDKIDALVNSFYEKKVSFLSNAMEDVNSARNRKRGGYVEMSYDGRYVK